MKRTSRLRKTESSAQITVHDAVATNRDVRKNLQPSKDIELSQSEAEELRDKESPNNNAESGVKQIEAITLIRTRRVKRSLLTPSKGAPY